LSEPTSAVELTELVRRAVAAVEKAAAALEAIARAMHVANGLRAGGGFP
jgi:hypothetical protein